MAVSLPAWCESTHGAGSVLVVAPHGGLSHEDLLSPAAATRRGNDLHTAGLARELAGRLGGSSLRNPTHDRNALDLNRLGEVLDRAPWFLDAIEDHLARILEAHPVAHVLVVHGWHVGQARCDLGIGASLAAADEAAGCARRLTVSPGFVTGGLEAFRRRLEKAGILATYGERWPAAHRNNLMRVFRRQPDPRLAPLRLRRWVEEGRIEAVQLELGVPLRWPGTPRASLVEAARRILAGGRVPAVSPPVDRPADRPADQPASDSRSVRSALGLHAFDTDCGAHGLGIVMGAMRLSGTAVGARLQLFPDGQRMGIFTGHGSVGPVLGVPDLHFEDTPDGFLAHF